MNATRLSANEPTVLLVAASNGYSGTEHIVETIADRAIADGMSVGVVVPRNESIAPLALRCNELGARIFRTQNVDRARDVPRNVWAMRSAIRATLPDVIHFHCPSPRWGLDLIASACGSRARVVRTEHNPILHTPGGAAGLVLRTTDRVVNAFTYVSAGNRERSESLLPARAGRGRTVHNGVDQHRFRPALTTAERSFLKGVLGVPESHHVALYLGSFGGRRSLAPVLEGYRLFLGLTDSPECWHLAIAGEGPLEERNLPEALRVPRVTFLGRRSDSDLLLRSADVVVTGSAFEGMSLSLLEAWASGTPVVAYRVDGISDVVGDDLPLVCATQGDFMNFARILNRVASADPATVAIHGKATETVREKFTEGAMADRYVRLYRELAAVAPSSNAARQTKSDSQASALETDSSSHS